MSQSKTLFKDENLICSSLIRNNFKLSSRQRRPKEHYDPIIGSSVTRWKNYFVNIWPFRKLKICPSAWNIWHVTFKMFPRTKLTLEMMPETFTILLKWSNFAKSGHNERLRNLFLLLYWRLQNWTIYFGIVAIRTTSFCYVLSG